MTSISPTPNKILMTQARDSLRGKWGLAIGVFVLFMLVLLILLHIPHVGWPLYVIADSVLLLGLAEFALSISRQQDSRLEQLFSGFKRFGLALGVYFLVLIFVLLWTLLLVVPGIIAAISYSMTYFIIADNESIVPLQALRKSKAMMSGNKWRFFCLCCRFIGWLLLSILTFGIGFLWFLPYFHVSVARFYEDIKVSAIEA